MIRVTVELIPGGDESSPRRKVLGSIDIVNDGTGTADVGNYTGRMRAEYTLKDRNARVTNFHRRRQSVMSLVGAFLKAWGHTTHSPKDIEKLRDE
jgi:hypothetical protein